MHDETEMRVRLNRLEQKVAFLLRELGLEDKEKELASVPLQDDITSLVRQGRKIEAIKLYRQRNNVGLKEAKDVIDNMGY